MDVYLSDVISDAICHAEQSVVVKVVESLFCVLTRQKKTRPTFSGYSDHAMLNLTKEFENKKMQM
jgi:hypothetical protein